MTMIKNVTEGKKKLKNLDFIVPIKLTPTTGWEKEKKEKEKIQKNLQNKFKNKNNKCFLKSLLSESFPSLGVTIHLTSLGCPPTLY